MAKSIIGFHYSIGGNKNGVGALMEKLNKAGIPFLMKGTDDAGLCFEGQQTGQKHGVKNHLIYRVSSAGQPGNAEYDVPDYTKSPQTAAQEHFDKTAAKWPNELKKDIVWMEPINEPRAKKSAGDVQFNNMHPTDWLGAFMLEYAKIANAQGFKVCGPSFNAGEPEVFETNDYELPGMLAYLQYCADNPTKAALSVHEYTWDRWTKNENWPDWYPILWGRVEAAMAACDKHGISRNFSIFMTEWGFAHEKAPQWPECEPYLTAYNEWAARWPQVKGVAAWTLQSGWGSVDNDLQNWFEPLGNYAVSQNFDPGLQPAQTHIQFGTTKPGQQLPGGVPGTTGTGSSSGASEPFRFTHYPTEHRFITQGYNANPEIYKPLGLTGHEGLDIMAPLGSKIFAVAGGEVTLIRNKSEGHAYGNAVYITHKDGYATAYAHLDSVKVTLGQSVSGGDLIGIADSTGHVRPKPTPENPGLGAHLHLTLYHKGATARGETQQRNDIIDPTPFLNAIPAPSWTPPAEPLTNGWGFAQSIQQQGQLGKVIFPNGINVRTQPNMNAAVLGLIPADTIVRVTGSVNNDYLPIQASSSLFDTTTTTPTGTFAREFVSFTATANLDATQPGTQFQATWVLRNTGTAVWQGNFPVAYLNTPIPENANTRLSSMGPATGHTIKSLSGRDEVQPGHTVTLTFNFDAPVTAGTWASHWQVMTGSGVAIGNPVWIRLIIKGTPVVITPTPTPTPTGRFQTGMNINPDAHGLDIDRLRDLQWVRWVYKAAAKNRNVDDAFNQQYRSLIQSYADAGIKSLIILNQETVWGNAPWHNGDWNTYAGSLSHAAARIAELCAAFGNKVAYQIWNEEDSHPSNPSAIRVEPNDFATILGSTAASIRGKHPGATVIIGGLNSGPDSAIAYAKQVRQQLGGSLPVDALAIHPYGRFVHNDPFYNQQFGRIQDALALWKQHFPNTPIWITEIGVADNNPIGPEHYEKIANYMREFVTEIADNHRDHVPVLLWFAWSDLMRNAGITTVDGQLKAHIGEAYKEFVARGQAPKPKALGEAIPGADSEFLRFQTTLADYTAVPAGSSFTNRWTYRNTGAVDWADGFKLVYSPNSADAAPMMDQTSYDLTDLLQPNRVAPGQEGTIVMTMTAPEQDGRHYTSRWELQDPNGQTFGFLYAEITVVPAPTAGTSVQTSDMTFIDDHTIPDDSRLPAGTTFNKQWRVRNSGVRHWGSGFRIVYVEGDLAMAKGHVSHVVPQAGRDETVILTVPMIAPAAQNNQPTTYSSLWRLQDDRGNFFGEPLWCRIVSLPSESGLALGPYSDPSGWYSQIDPRWKNIPLGHTGQATPTIGSWGCLLTCYAMMLTAYRMRFNPAELNNRLKQIGNDGFQGPVVQFAAPTRLLPGLTRHGNLRSNRSPVLDWTEWTGEDPIGRIDNAIANGHTVIAQVDRSPNDGRYHADTESHWVILVARTADGSDYLMLDPMTPANQLSDQPKSLMAKYGKRIPSRPNEENLRNAIQSALVYRFNGAVGSG